MSLFRLILTLAFSLMATGFPVVASSAGTSVEALQKAAEEGSKAALYNLGVRYGSGDGVKEDRELANVYYMKAALKNYAPAQNNLGWSYRQGLGARKDPKAALFWFRLAALQGNALAIQNLAEMFADGEGVPPNPELAERLYASCAVQPMQEAGQGGQTGINNAIHECRRMMAIVVVQRNGADQDALRRAAFWLRTSLNDLADPKLDSEVGVRARRSAKETKEAYQLVDSRLDKASRQWVKSALKNWAEIRSLLEDQAEFPLTLLDCQPSDIKI